MLARTSFIAGVLLFGTSLLAFGQEEPLQIAHFPEATITVDGDLSDWTVIDATSEEIKDVYPESKVIQLLDGRFVTVGPQQDAAQKAGNLSASIRTFSDNNKLYLAVRVTDDVLNLGESLLGYTYRDDAVEIILDWGRHFKFRVTADYEGNTVIDGSDFNTELPYPMLMEVLGVEAILAETETGYDVEVSIPLRALRLAGWESGQTLGLTVKVFDDDKGSASGYLNLTGSKTEDGKDKYRAASLEDGGVNVPESSAGWNQVRILGGNELEITLDGSGAVEEDRVVVEALKCTWAGEWDKAEAMLKSLPQSPRITSILGKVQLTALWRGHTKSSDKALATLSKVAQESEVNSLVQWATWAVAKEQEHENKFDVARETYKGSLTRKDNPVVQRCYALLLLNIANSYLAKLDFEKAEEELKEVINSCNKCSTQVSSAKMILGGIDRRRLSKE